MAEEQPQGGVQLPPVALGYSARSYSPLFEFNELTVAYPCPTTDDKENIFKLLQHVNVLIHERQCSPARGFDDNARILRKQEARFDSLPIGHDVRSHPETVTNLKRLSGNLLCPKGGRNT